MVKRRNARVRKSSTKNWGQRGESQAIPATVLIPSGRCPLVVESTSEEDIKDWVRQLTERKPPVVTYDRSVYRYWLRHSFDINSSDYREAADIVEAWVPDRVKTIDDLGF